MIFPGTKLMCNDNSGALIVKCIGIKKASKITGATVGSLIIVSIKNCSKGLSKVQKGSIHYAIITRIKSTINWISKNGEFSTFFENSVVIVSKKNNYTPVGTRVFGPIAREVRSKVFLKIVLLSSGVF